VRRRVVTHDAVTTARAGEHLDHLLHDADSQRRPVLQIVNHAPAISWKRFLGALSAAVVLCGWVAPASAVVIKNGDGTANTTAPTDDFGFDNVGRLNSSSGVYLGNRWVLTVNHVHAGTIWLEGTSYGKVSGAELQLMNPPGSGLTETTELLLYRISSDPGLPDLNISHTAPSDQSTIVMAGNGFNREANLSYWNEDGSPASPSDYDARGYKTIPSQSIRWGDNKVKNNDVEVTLQYVTGGQQVTFDMIALQTVFDFATGSTTYESQAWSHDSGGGVFYKRAGNWELTGIIVAADKPSNLSWGLQLSDLFDQPGELLRADRAGGASDTRRHERRRRG